MITANYALNSLTRLVMKIFDISQPIFGCEVYPGDPTPERATLSSIDGGDLYNLTVFSMCAHNGTHVDAPSHFIKDGDTVSEIDLTKTVGYAYVARFDGEMSGNDAENILREARKASEEASKRILIAGDAIISNEACETFASGGILLLGNESQSVGPEGAPMAAHLTLLSRGVVLLEGVRLGGVPEGEYLLSCAPILLNGCDGAPCRAILISES